MSPGLSCTSSKSTARPRLPGNTAEPWNDTRRRRLRPALPLTLADFDRRGFPTGGSPARPLLEGHARAFLDGFNRAAANWPTPHACLTEAPADSRGFAYEGAGMYAGLRDWLTGGRSGAVHALLAGPGDRYTHLVHVGAGWAATPMRLPHRTPLPDTPLLRWLALDGAGFGRAFFGGRQRVIRDAQSVPADGRRRLRWAAALAGSGRALWFIHVADVEAIRHTIEPLPAAARTELWAGVGLAMTYAGGVETAEMKGAVAAAGPDRASLGQGVVFGTAARARAGAVPPHTAAACQTVLQIDDETAAAWATEAATPLGGQRGVEAYEAWRQALRARVAGQH